MEKPRFLRELVVFGEVGLAGSRRSSSCRFDAPRSGFGFAWLRNVRLSFSFQKTIPAE